MPPCKKCGRALKNLISIRLGIGPVCLAKEQEKQKNRLMILGVLLNYPKILEDDEYVDKGRDI